MFSLSLWRIHEFKIFSRYNHLSVSKLYAKKERKEKKGRKKKKKEKEKEKKSIEEERKKERREKRVFPIIPFRPTVSIHTFTEMEMFFLRERSSGGRVSSVLRLSASCWVCLRRCTWSLSAILNSVECWRSVNPIPTNAWRPGGEEEEEMRMMVMR